MKLRLRHLGHRFGEASPWLFRGVEAVVSAGERCALTGPSGSGKSTLLSIVAGWLAPSEGDVVTEDLPGMQWVFQNSLGVSRRAAIDHVRLPMLARGLRFSDATTRSEEMCETVGLGYLRDRRPFSMLSGGEAQRLMLARALAFEPELLLVDEPTAQLDRRSAAAVNLAIASLGSAGGIVLIATHDADTAAACDRQLDLAQYATGPEPGRDARRDDQGGVAR